MEVNEVVLSDVHTSTQFNILSEIDSSVCNISPKFSYSDAESGVPAELKNLAGMKKNIYIGTACIKSAGPALYSFYIPVHIL